jgi:hypothetical protein
MLRPYDPHLDFNSANVGVSVTVPRLEPIEDPPPAATTPASAAEPGAAVATELGAVAGLALYDGLNS